MLRPCEHEHALARLVNKPKLSKIREREWYFFVPRNKKHGNGGRPNRTTKNGFWKATGSDRKIFSLSDRNKHLGLKKTLVFYKGRAPRGSKTDWVMSEYRLPDSCPFSKDIVLCKIYRKATSMKVLEQRAALEEAQPNSISGQHLDFLTPPPIRLSHVASNTNENYEASNEASLKLPIGSNKLSELRLPKSNMDWSQDSQLRADKVKEYQVTKLEGACVSHNQLSLLSFLQTPLSPSSGGIESSLLFPLFFYGFSSPLIAVRDGSTTTWLPFCVLSPIAYSTRQDVRRRPKQLSHESEPLYPRSVGTLMVFEWKKSSVEVLSAMVDVTVLKVTAIAPYISSSNDNRKEEKKKGL
ncbi:hypothetical protein L1987_72788 [Smallanthus sonchifolius]|uniref:Uncharacterized protein n=1 Tax=Smallanthus sonchifolius TaxID=185202 RepID=A0ACB9AWF7_9ASTR|nr:hypothetical protein L1987_72788 [Smallanthus sonchifolius]